MHLSNRSPSQSSQRRSGRCRSTHRPKALIGARCFGWLLLSLLLGCSTVVVGSDITGKPWVSITTSEEFVDEDTGSVLCTTTTRCYTFRVDGTNSYESTRHSPAVEECGRDDVVTNTWSSSGEWSLFAVDEDGATFLNLHRTQSSSSVRQGDEDLTETRDDSVTDDQVGIAMGNDRNGALLYIASGEGAAYRRDSDGVCE